MIAFNDVVIALVVVAAVVAIGSWWTWRGFWRAKCHDAYQDGHTAGIETQIARQRRALGRKVAEDKRITDAYLERIRPATAADPATEVIGGALAAVPAPRPPADARPDLPFPEALPPDLRDWVKATWKMPAIAELRYLP